jgi:hypothetical protein
MKIAFIIVTFNRPNIAQLSFKTLFGNTSIKPDYVTIIDDSSEIEYRKNLFEFCNQNGFNFVSHGKNLGIGFSFEKAYSTMREYEDVDLVCFIESDYVWRKGWLEDVVSVFESSPYTIAISGCNHPDMYDRVKTHSEFPKLMIDQFGHDLQSREHLYQPFILETPTGKIEVQGVSNSCGCQIVNWKRLKEIFSLNIFNDPVYNSTENLYWKFMERAFHKNNTGNRRYASDAHMSGTLSMFAEKHMLYKGIDISKNFGFLDICDYSISSHICGGGINGMIVPEGSTFVGSPKFKIDYLEKNPRYER